ncbi:MAG: anaerobic glycerol-3-phosphate dehydrogenase subunit B, partial [Smithellaceae bacterium]|nr:anaerobic glycerol-3-phosphate dehydrogenase subunit B [Smithellaceae bacterium]
SLASFTALFPPPYSFTAPEGKNSLIPTGAGTRRSTYLLPESFLAGADADMDKTLIVGIEGFKDFHAEYVAHHLKCRGITVTIPRETGNVTNAAGLASLMDDPSFCRDFACLIKKRIAGENSIGLPALLGLRSSSRAQEIIRTETGCQVFEIPILPPSIPGMRIFHRFKEYLTARGVSIIQGHQVESSLRKGKRCLGINVTQPPLTRTYTADNFILATGRFFSGGLQTDENRIYEPILDLPILQPPARRDWFRRRFFDPRPHPIHEAGVLTDHELRPVDQEGNLLWENLRVAGSLLTHHDSTQELSREGVALATGYAAAKWSGGR